MLLAASGVDRAVHFFSERFTYSTGYRGAVFLILGGLLLMTFVVGSFLLGAGAGRDARPLATPDANRPRVLTHVRSRAPRRSAGLALRAARATLDSPREEFENGLVSGKRVRARTIDGVLDRFADADLGEPRIISSGPRQKVVRLYACRTCAGLPGPSARPVCEFERGFLTAAFANLVGTPASVRERACAGAGADHCEFEVTY